MSDCLFCKIAEGAIPAEKLHEDELAVAFADVNPQAPIHFLVIPKRHIASINDLTPEDEALVGHLYTVARQVAHEQGVAESGYRAVMNCGRDGQQSVFHIHLHVLAGRQLQWPPG